MRNLIILILIIVGLAMARWLITDVIRAVQRALGPSGDPSDRAESQRTQPDQDADQTRTGHMVRDPVSGTYIDEQLAIKEMIDGEPFYFESKENRDAYLRQARS